MTTATIQWVPFTKRTLRQINRQWDGLPKVVVGSYAFVGSEIIGEIFAFHPDDSWYGQFAGERIGNCLDEAMAKANVEHRWKLATQNRTLEH